MNEEYKQSLCNAMSWIASKSNTIILGQSVLYPGTGCYDTLAHVPENKRLEFPVAENLQLGVSIGLALNGFVPVSVFPRWNFLLCATDQIINHLDKLKDMSNNGYTPNVIIRVAVGSTYPINPQEQHKGNFSEAFRQMCSNVEIIECTHHHMILPAYQQAYNRKDGKSTIIVEFPETGI